MKLNEKITTKQHVAEILELFSKPLWLKVGYQVGMDRLDAETITTQAEHTEMVISALQDEGAYELLLDVLVDTAFGC